MPLKCTLLKNENFFCVYWYRHYCSTKVITYIKTEKRTSTYHFWLHHNIRQRLRDRTQWQYHPCVTTTVDQDDLLCPWYTDHNHIKRQIFEHCHYGNHLTGDGNSNADDGGGGPKMVKTEVNSAPVNTLANDNRRLKKMATHGKIIKYLEWKWCRQTNLHKFNLF